VDASCISQQDKVEKTAQVSRMHEIYSTGSNVYIWLGVGETGAVGPDETEEKFHFMRQILSFRRLD
jgi:alpha-tubulin suppressor-like RCC1 family protein